MYKLDKCKCSLKISKTVISKKNDLFYVEYGVGFMMDYKIKFETFEPREILFAGSPFCPHHLPRHYSYIE